MQSQEQDTARVSAAEAGLKKVDQRHLYFAQGQGFNFHQG
jgi:hypothetical protein